MAIQHSTPAHAHSSHAHGAHAAHHSASKARPGPGAEEGEGGFAAMLRAQPLPEKDAEPADRPVPAEANKPDDGAPREARAQSGDGKDRDEKKAPARPEPDPALLAAWTPPAALPTTALADKAAPESDPLAALRKAAGRGRGQGGDALAALGSARPAAGAGTGVGVGVAKADPLGLAGKVAPDRADITAALAKADEAVKAATDARDSLAALLPQPDPVAIQAGAVGASPAAMLDPNQGAQPAQATPPAQASLPMPPQSPAFAPALGHQIEVWMKGGVQHAEVQLSPQELGPIRVRIEMEGATTRVHMAADVAATRDALQQAIPQLSDALGQVGISLSGGGVSDQPAFQQARADAEAGFGGGGRSGSARSDAAAAGADDGVPAGMAAATRPLAQRRGLLDTYA